MSSVRPSDLVRSTGFRIGLAYTAVFLASTAALGGIVHYIAVDAARTEIRAFAANEVTRLADVHQRFGVPGLVAAAADDTEAPEGVDPLRVLVIDRAGRRLTGSLPPLMARADGPFLLERRDGELSILGVGQVLRDGTFLAAGQSDASLRRTSRAILNAFLIGGGLAAALALVGAVFTARSVARRIARIDATMRAIVAGDLSARVPGRGTDDEFDRLTAGINGMLDRIEALMADLRRVTTDVAHDLRTPLARLRQTLEQARAEARDTEDWAARTEVAIAEVDRLLDIFTALLRIAEIEARARRAAFAPVDLSALARDLAETYDAVAEESGHRLAAAVEPGVTAVADRALLAQALSNLVENALRHTPPGTAITIGVAAAPEGARLFVRDDGPGIPEGLREEVLKPFHRLDRSRTTAGNGLGLALVKAVATLHEATLTLTGADPGLEVALLLPATRRAEA